MAYAKAVVDFSKYPDGGLAGPGRTIHDTIAANAAVFPNLPVTMAAFDTQLDDWDTVLGESLKGGTDRTNAKNAARAALEETLFQLGTYVNLVAKGDQSIIDKSGFPGYTTERASSSSGVDFVPENVRWEHGTVSGQEVLRWKGDGTHSMYEVHVCTGDPNTPANWTDRGAFSGGRAVLDGFTPGTVIWGRVRKLGKSGDYGNWSDPAQIRVN